MPSKTDAFPDFPTEEEIEEIPDQVNYSVEQTGSVSPNQDSVIYFNLPVTNGTVAEPIKHLWALHLDDDFQGKVQLIINSPGGEMSATWALIDTMEAVRYQIDTIAIGTIASAAFLIFITGQKRIMAPNSIAMIHHYSGYNEGKYTSLVASRRMQDIAFQRMAQHIVKNSKYKTIKEVTDSILLDEDNWLTPKEMKVHGLCDVISKPKRKNRNQ